MAQQPIPVSAVATVKGPAMSLWFSFDPNEDEKELWHLEQELSSELERIEQKSCETVPIGKSGNEVSYVDDDEDEDEEEEDNDDDESEERDESDDEEIIDDAEEVPDD